MKKVFKVIGVIALAAVVGGVAGLSMYAVTKSTGVLDSYKNAVSEVVAETRGEGKDETTANDNGFILGNHEEKAPEIVYSDSNDVSSIVEAAIPSVVAITGKTEYQAYNSLGGWGSLFGIESGEPQTYEAQSAGSGIIIGEDDDEYMIATNNHVIQNAKELIITFADDSTAPASVKGADADKDVAVISVKKADLQDGTEQNIKVANIGDSNNLKVGEGVVAIGNALGEGLSVTTGIISALDKSVSADGATSEGLIQTDAAINPGNSGGALLNMAGELIGINEAKYASTQVEGMGFAIPITSVEDLLEDFSNHEVREAVSEAEQGYIGIQGQSIDEQMAANYDMPQGVYVYKIVENAPAAKSGLREKDIITKFDGQSVHSMEDLQEKLTGYKDGEKVKITVERLNGEEYDEVELEIELEGKAALS